MLASGRAGLGCTLSKVSPSSAIRTDQAFPEGKGRGRSRSEHPPHLLHPQFMLHGVVKKMQTLRLQTLAPPPSVGPWASHATAQSLNFPSHLENGRPPHMTFSRDQLLYFHHFPKPLKPPHKGHDSPPLDKHAQREDDTCQGHTAGQAPAPALEWTAEMPCPATIPLQRDPWITGSLLQEERPEDWVGGGWEGREGGPQVHRVLEGRPRREGEGCQGLPRALAHLGWRAARA